MARKIVIIIYYNKIDILSLVSFLYFLIICLWANTQYKLYFSELWNYVYKKYKRLSRTIIKSNSENKPCHS